MPFHTMCIYAALCNVLNLRFCDKQMVFLMEVLLIKTRTITESLKEMIHNQQKSFNSVKSEN
jgi:hypothetical protein